VKFKSRYLILVIVLFLVIVFLDQNRSEVPVKIIVGNPYHLGLSIIIIISVLVGMLVMIGGMYLINRRRKRNK
jgi:uncharacterized integral membrane protein